VDACTASLDRLGVDKIGLYQLHWPSLFNNEAYWDGIATCYEKGYIEAVGVSNYGPKQMKSIHEYLKDRGIPLSSNQIQYSLLCRSAESNELLKTAKELNVTVIAYSPLGLGLLTGKYSKENQPKSLPRKLIAKNVLDKIDPLLTTMKEIAASKSEATALNITLTQIALNWCIAKGTVPIPGARSLEQAIDICNTLKWTLNDEDVRLLDDAAKLTNINLATPLQGR
jgi:pyridoxine 4-dehydrogenase